MRSGPSGISRKSKRKRKAPSRFRDENVPDLFREVSPRDEAFTSGNVNTVEPIPSHGDSERYECLQTTSFPFEGREDNESRPVGRGEEPVKEGSSHAQCDEIAECGHRNESFQASDDENEHIEDEGPPQMLYLTRGNARGSIKRVSDSRAQVVLRYFVTTSISCPCENDSCQSLVNVGRWGKMGGGSRVCVHCKLLRKGEWLGSGFGFMGKEDLVRHLNSSQCQTARGIPVSRNNAKQELGEELVYTINNPVNKKRKEVESGATKDFFTCPKCQKECLWRSRFAHCLHCYASR